MPAWVVSARESAERDRAAIEKGTPSRSLMQRAGNAAAAEITRRYGERLKSGAVVFTGPGNNGGDGWVVASALAAADIRVSVVEVGTADPRKSPDAVAEREAALSRGVVTRDVPADTGIVVDALLGTGFEGEPRAVIADAIARVNSLRAKGAVVTAMDVPSGLNATTGQHSTVVHADLTTSFGGVKRGLLLARDCCGEIAVIDIGLDDARSSRPLRLPVLIDSDWVKSRVPPIRYDAHKGTRKHLAIVGSGAGMPGAVVLAARAALRSGIGLVRTMVAQENAGAVLTAVPSALNASWPESDARIKTEIASWADAIVIGPGLGKSKESRELVERILSVSDLPVLLDADALNVFAGDTTSLARLLLGKKALLTPHVAEFARLMDTTADNVLANRFDIGTDLAQKVGAVVLLKGTPTVIFSPDSDRFVVARGTAALGTGGSGDILSGVAGTMLAQLGDAVDAAVCAAWIHGRAAELCGYVRGTTLEDVLYALPRAWNEQDPVCEPPVLAVLPNVAR